MTEPMPQFPTVPTEPVAEYTQEQYEAYLRYQAEQKAEQQQVSADTGASFQPIPVSTNPGANVQPTPANAVLASGVQPTPLNVNPGANSQTAPVNVNPGSGYQSPPVNSATAGSTTNDKPKSSAQQWPTEPAKDSAKDSAKDATKDSAKDSAKESAKEAATAAKETASAVFGEVKSAVSIASKREPYALLAVASAGFTLLWLIWRENDTFGAEKLKLWTVFVIASVSLVFTPIVRKVFRLDPLRAWQFAVGGASGLGFAWVAFLLPNIDSNQAFFGTLAVAAGGLAAWTAPGRPE